MGQFKKAGLTPFRVLRDFQVDEPGSVEVGQEIRVDIFNPGEKVKVIGTSKGKGFAGVMKRWNFGGGKERMAPDLTGFPVQSVSVHGPAEFSKARSYRED